MTATEDAPPERLKSDESGFLNPERLIFNVHSKLDEKDVKLLADGLNTHSAGLGIQTSIADFGVFAYDKAKVVKGGIAVQTGWALSYIKLLWVSQDFRRQGLGRMLVLKAEEISLERGCHTMAVDTFNYQAPHFYPKLGFQEFGRISGLGDNRTLTRLWFTKRIA